MSQQLDTVDMLDIPASYHPSCFIQCGDHGWWVFGGAFKFLSVKLKALSLHYQWFEKKYVPILLLSKCMQLVAKAFMSLCNLCQSRWPQNILVLLYSFAAGEHTMHLAQSTLVYVGLPPQKPLDVLMCEIMLLWDNIHWVWLAVPMQPYLPNGFLIWVDRSTIGSYASIVMHLTRNKAGINFPRSPCGAFWMAVCLCLEEHLLPFCWPLCPFPHEHITPIEMITAFQSVVIKHLGRVFKTLMSFIALNHSYQRNELGSYQYGSGSSNCQKSTCICPGAILCDLSSGWPTMCFLYSDLQSYIAHYRQMPLWLHISTCSIIIFVASSEDVIISLFFTVCKVDLSM